MPFWSVIVPVHERTTYLKQALDSVLDQDPGPEQLEILVMDNASTAPLEAWVAAHGRGRVRYVRNPTNLGMYGNFNRGIGLSNGRWLHILCDDDWVLPGFYARMRAALETQPATTGVGFSHYQNWHEPEGLLWSPAPFLPAAGAMPMDFLHQLVMGNPLNLPAVVYRREAFERPGPFREDLPFCADWEWYLRSFLQWTWYHLPETLACYRVHAHNATKTLEQSGMTADNIRRTVEGMARWLPAGMATAVLPAARRVHATRFLASAHQALEHGNAGLADRFIREAVRLHPEVVQSVEFAALLRLAGTHALGAGVHR